MPIITGIDRHQVSFSSLEDGIAADNEVRFIDAFVDKLNLQLLGVHSLTSSDKRKKAEQLSAMHFFSNFTFMPISMAFAAVEN